MRHAVIMAGGIGTRLWPLSRRNRPKQLLRLFDGQSLLQHARERLRDIVPAERTWIITAADHLDQVAEELPDLPAENLIGEPIGRDTANAIGLAAHLIHGRDPASVMGVFTADHLITPVDQFVAAVDRGLTAADDHPDHLITFGITPTHPHTGYGYVHRGAPVDNHVYAVISFHEKPDLATAKALVGTGEYYWNSGMFAWRTTSIIAELHRHLPINNQVLGQLADGWYTAQGSAEAATRFADLQRISIDFAVLEHADNVLVVPMRCNWRDVGSWADIATAVGEDTTGNTTINAASLVLDGNANILVGERDHLIVTIGCTDLVVVQTDDVTLLCRRDDVQRVKDAVDRCGEQFGDQYL